MTAKEALKKIDDGIGQLIKNKDAIEIPTLMEIEGAVKQRVHNQGLDSNGVTIGVNGKNKGKYTRSYERFKARKVGEDIYPINLELNSDLRKGYTTGTASGVNVIKFQDDLSQKKAGRHEENYKTQIFRPSLNNLEDAKEVMRKQGEAVLRGAFRR